MDKIYNFKQVHITLFSPLASKDKPIDEPTTIDAYFKIVFQIHKFMTTVKLCYLKAVYISLNLSMVFGCSTITKALWYSHVT